MFADGSSQNMGGAGRPHFLPVTVKRLSWQCFGSGFGHRSPLLYRLSQKHDSVKNTTQSKTLRPPHCATKKTDVRPLFTSRLVSPDCSELAYQHPGRTAPSRFTSAGSSYGEEGRETAFVCDG